MTRVYTKRSTKSHGSTIIKIVPCGVHPLHFVEVRASGARRGCPMCEIQIEDICRSLTPTSSGNHAPRITQDRTRIVGCTCGWRTPPGTTDSDNAFTEHYAIRRLVEEGRTNGEENK